MFARVKKAILVCFITCLIWVWADLSLDDVLPDQTITIAASRANPKFWATIEGRPDVSIKADITGSAGKIREFAQKVDKGEEKLEVVLDPEKLNMVSQGEYKLQDVRKFLAESNKIKDYGLGIQSVRPDILNIKIVELKEKTLPLKCVDEMGLEITGAKMTPDIITMLAPEGTDAALIKLITAAEKKQARGAAIEKKPYIELAGGEIRTSDIAVKVELPAVADEMKPYTISGNLGFLMSANLLGIYKVEFTKRPETGSISILATDEAKAAYDARQFEVLLEIQDEDVGKAEVVRQVVYNFPLKYVAEDKIRLTGEAAEARFRLVPVNLPSVPLTIE